MALQLDRRGQSTAKAIALATLLWVAVLGLTLGGCASDGSSSGDGAAAAEAEEDRPGRIEPRYQPREPIPEPFYNTDYLFGMTRGVTNSTIHPAAQVPLLVLTIPLDIVFLPFAAIGGFF